MNRRRFLSMLSVLPAALALPTVKQRRTVTFHLSSPSSNFAQDLRYATLLLGKSGPEIFPRRFV